jgi:hypothetical protein
MVESWPHAARGRQRVCRSVTELSVTELASLMGTGDGAEHQPPIASHGVSTSRKDSLARSVAPMSSL